MKKWSIVAIALLLLTAAGSAAVLPRMLLVLLGRGNRLDESRCVLCYASEDGRGLFADHDV